MNRSTLLIMMAAGRARLVDRLASLSDDAMLDPIDEAWTLKDVLAHLEAWERRVGRRPRGPPPGRHAGSIGRDGRAQRPALRGQSRPRARRRASQDEAYRSPLATIDGASDDELFDGRHFAWTAGEPLASWFRGNTDEHYDEHLEQLTRPL